MSKSDRIDVYLVAGGKFHNIDHARVEILKLLAEQPRIKVLVGADFSDIDAICASDFLITYTCDVLPTEAETERLRDFVNGGKKWFALHGTNSILRFMDEPAADGTPGLIARKKTCPSWTYWAVSLCPTPLSTSTKCMLLNPTTHW